MGELLQWKPSSGAPVASFEAGLRYVLRHEDPELSGIIVAEPGGHKARFGINSLAHPEAITAGFYEMERLTALEWASKVYRTCYFEPIGGFQVNNQMVCNKFFDLAVNTGIREATKILQRAVNSLRPRPSTATDLLFLQEDGKPGQRTIDAINESSSGDLMVAIRHYGTEFYKDVVRRQPADQKYFDGWILRLNS